MEATKLLPLHYFPYFPSTLSDSIPELFKCMYIAHYLMLETLRKWQPETDYLL